MVTKEVARRIVSSPPCLFGGLGALALLVVCIVFPGELFGYEPRFLLASIVIWGVTLSGIGIVLWAVVRSVFKKSRTERRDDEDA